MAFGRVAKGEEFNGGIDALAPRLLHDRNGIGVEPADQVGSEGSDHRFEGGFQSGAERVIEFSIEFNRSAWAMERLASSEKPTSD